MKHIGGSLIVAVALAASAPVLYAQSNNTIIVPRITNGQLNSLQSRQQRLNFQQQQQFNRQIDSLSNQQRRQQLNVPVMKPTCSPQQASIGC